MGKILLLLQFIYSRLDQSVCEPSPELFVICFNDLGSCWDRRGLKIMDKVKKKVKKIIIDKHSGSLSLAKPPGNNLLA